MLGIWLAVSNDVSIQPWSKYVIGRTYIPEITGSSRPEPQFLKHRYTYTNFSCTSDLYKLRSTEIEKYKMSNIQNNIFSHRPLPMEQELLPCR